MAAITGTLVGNTEMAGQYKIITLTAPIESASDAITLTAGSHGGVKSIVAILGAVITGGQDAEFAGLQVSFSGLVVTVDSVGQDGTNSTAWSDTTVTLSLLVALE